ncbi:MAG: FtsX-like permease family protein [Chlorobi bacterium]|nr:FtsX-like permease family protein [Chlorobiota bacterium]
MDFIDTPLNNVRWIGTFREYLSIARRILGSRKTRLLSFTRSIAVGSVALSSAALLITLAVLDGFEYQLEAKTSLFVGQLDARRITSAHLPIGRWLAALTNSSSDIIAATAYSEIEALLTHRTAVEPVLVRSDTPLVTHRWSALGIGTNWQPTAFSIACGRPLAERLGVQISDTVTILVTSQTESARASFSSIPFPVRVTVGAIFESGMRQFDETYVLASPLLIKHLRDNSSPTGFSIWLSHPQHARSVAHLLDSLYGTVLFVRTFDELFPAMFTWISLQKRPIPIVVGILSIVAAFNIMTMLFVAIVERRNNVAILRLIGLSSKALLVMITGYGVWIAVSGFTIGLMIAVGFQWLQHSFHIIHLDSSVYFLDALPIELAWRHIWIVAFVVSVLVLSVCILPAAAAARITPLQLLRIK